MMRAIVQSAYGNAEKVLSLQEVQKPALDADKHASDASAVLLKVKAVSLNSADWRITNADPWILRAMFGWRRPKAPIRGSDVAGIVEEIGANVTEFEVGDAVMGFTPEGTGGGLAEYVKVPAANLVKKPAGVSYAQASTLGVASFTALDALSEKLGNLKSGEKVLVNGASGGVGTFTVSLCKERGASHITAVTSTRNLDMVRSLAPDIIDVVDYTKVGGADGGKGSVAEQILAQQGIADGDDANRYDLIVDNVGSVSMHDASKLLKKDKGIYVGVGFGTFGNLFSKIATSKYYGVNYKMLSSKSSSESLKACAAKMASGALRGQVERVYDGLEESIEAMAHLETNHARAKLVIKVSDWDDDVDVDGD